MGCDIHAVMEARDSDAEPWKVLKEYGHLDRSYDMFGALVADHPRERDIHGDVPARGLPADAADHLIYLGDHTYSWLTAEEFMRACKKYEALWPLPEGYSHILWDFTYPEHKQVRLVFGFDS